MNPRAEALKKRTFEFALRIVYFCRGLRETWEGRELADQIFRSGTRVGANYRAACRGRSHDDFVAKLGHVVEEADESVYWLELIAAANASNDPKLPDLITEANELSAIFNHCSNESSRAGFAQNPPIPQSPIQIPQFVDS